MTCALMLRGSLWRSRTGAMQDLEAVFADGLACSLVSWSHGILHAS